MLAVDADDLKHYIGCFGHTVGDRVIQARVKALSVSARRSGDLTTCIDGEAFAIFLPDSDSEGMTSVAETVHEAVAGLVVEAGGKSIS